MFIWLVERIHRIHISYHDHRGSTCSQICERICIVKSWNGRYKQIEFMLNSQILMELRYYPIQLRKRLAPTSQQWLAKRILVRWHMEHRNTNNMMEYQRQCVDLVLEQQQQMPRLQQQSEPNERQLEFQISNKSYHFEGFFRK